MITRAPPVVEWLWPLDVVALLSRVGFWRSGGRQVRHAATAHDLPSRHSVAPAVIWSRDALAWRLALHLWLRRRHAGKCPSYGPSILRIRWRCRPPSKGVSSHTRTIASASSWETVRAPRERTLASLCARLQMAVCSFQQTPQRMPRTRLATIASPLPEPPNTMPRWYSPRATASATGRMKSG